MTDTRAPQAAIDAHRAELFKPGVLSLRPGYESKDGWLTGRQAVVVTVDQKTSDPSPNDRLPDEVDGVPVDVRQASPAKRLELTHPSEYAKQLRISPDRGSVPHFADEITTSDTQPAPLASAHAQLAKIAKGELDYQPPAGVALTPVTKKLTVQLAASPDNGWGVLNAFLAQTKSELTVAMYDFTSQHIQQAVSRAIGAGELSLVIDHPATNATADQTDAATVKALADELHTRFHQAWALTRTDKNATAWIYPYAYHIKVAVQDRARLWLSSGNWNNSNQPEIDPLTVEADKDTARHGDRDWHVVIDDAELAGVFGAFIDNDLQIADARNGPDELPGPSLAPHLSKTTTPVFASFFAPTTISDTMTVTPLLTPDPGVYTTAVLNLIESATERLFLQFQYIELPHTDDPSSAPFLALVDAVIDRQKAGVDLRIILGQSEKTGYLEQLLHRGLDVPGKVKVQNNVHNKGIVVDDRAVLVSSQNWSADGTLHNRDAGVIVAHPQAAAYFAQLFLHDWEHLARTRSIDD